MTVRTDVQADRTSSYNSLQETDRYYDDLELDDDKQPKINYASTANTDPIRETTIIPYTVLTTQSNTNKPVEQIDNTLEDLEKMFNDNSNKPSVQQTPLVTKTKNMQAQPPTSRSKSKTPTSVNTTTPESTTTKTRTVSKAFKDTIETTEKSSRKKTENIATKSLAASPSTTPVTHSRTSKH